jgi:hypothetical protein
MDLLSQELVVTHKTSWYGKLSLVSLKNGCRKELSANQLKVKLFLICFYIFLVFYIIFLLIFFLFSKA